MTNDISKAAATLGRKGGSATTPAKRAASAANGRKGGRPRTLPATEIAFSATDDWGTDGAWFEGATSLAVTRRAWTAGRACGWSDAETESAVNGLVHVGLSSLPDLKGSTWKQLHGQWETAQRMNWTSPAVDAAIAAEQSRRSQTR